MTTILNGRETLGWKAIWHGLVYSPATYFAGMVFMTFTLTFAGTVQTHLQRVMGMNYMEVQDQLWVFYAMRFASGIAVVLGALLFIYAVLAPRKEVIEPGMQTPAE